MKPFNFYVKYERAFYNHHGKRNPGSYALRGIFNRHCRKGEYYKVAEVLNRYCNIKRMNIELTYHGETALTEVVKSFEFTNPRRSFTI